MNKKNLENISETGQSCPYHPSELIWEEEICRDYNPLDKISWTEYTLHYCKKCGDREQKLIRMNFWKELSEQEKIPDLKYWELNYNRTNDCFVLKIDNIRYDGINEEESVPSEWKVELTKEEMKKLGDEELKQNIITKKIKKLAEKIRKDRQLSNLLNK